MTYVRISLKTKEVSIRTGLFTSLRDYRPDANVVDLALDNYPNEDVLLACLKQNSNLIEEFVVFRLVGALSELHTKLKALPNYYRLFDTGKWLEGADVSHLLSNSASQSDITAFTEDVNLYIKTFEPYVLLTESISEWITRQRYIARRRNVR